MPISYRSLVISKDWPSHTYLEVQSVPAIPSSVFQQAKGFLNRFFHHPHPKKLIVEEISNYEDILVQFSFYSHNQESSLTISQADLCKNFQNQQKLDDNKIGIFFEKKFEFNSQLNSLVLGLNNPNVTLSVEMIFDEKTNSLEWVQLKRENEILFKSDVVSERKILAEQQAKERESWPARQKEIEDRGRELQAKIEERAEREKERRGKVLFNR